MAGREFHKFLEQDLQVGIGPGTKTSPTGGTLTGTLIGIHTFAVGGVAWEGSWEPGVIGVGSKVSTTIAVPGASMKDFVLRSFSLDLQECVFSADVTADDTVEVVLVNHGDDPVTIASGTLRVMVLKAAV